MGVNMRITSGPAIEKPGDLVAMLTNLNEGDILEVLLAEGEPLDNVPRNAKEQGYNVLSIEHVEGTTHRVTIKK